MGTVAGLGSRNASVILAGGGNLVGWLRSRKSWCESRGCTPEGFLCLFRQIWESSKATATALGVGNGMWHYFPYPHPSQPTRPYAATI